MNPIILPAILLLIAVILVVISSLIKKWIANTDVNVSRLRTELMNFKIETKHRDYNARKRDENLLREVHQSSKKEAEHYGSICDSLSDNNIKFDAFSKLCRGIENVVRKGDNEGIETRSGLNQIKKCLKEVERISHLFEETLEKAKKIGRKG